MTKSKKNIIKNFENPSNEREYLLAKLKLKQREKESLVKGDFLEFVKHMWPEFIEGYHHKIIAEKFNKLARGEIKRLIVNMPPRHTKSEFASNYLPAWMIGQNPKLKIIQTTHTAELAVRFGRKAKNLIDSPEYQEVFKTKLQEDSKAAGRWETEGGGEYFAAGVGGAITGRGADLLIIDDPHKEQDAMSKEGFDKAYEWYTSGPRQRLQPGGAIVVVMTRWSTKDLTGCLIHGQKEVKGDQWELIEFPAIMPSGLPVWPEYWKLDELEKVEATLPIAKWNAQWMQAPTAEEGALIKREWWQDWPHENPPQTEFIIQSYDTAFLKKETADYSAITTWGVFRPSEDSTPCLMLLDAMKGRWDFPELKAVATEEYTYWKPEACIIEAKASGLPLIQELRRTGIPVQEFTPGRGKDKVSRVNAVSPVFSSGMVFYPEGKQFAHEVIEECAAFPHGDNDDLVDSTTQAVLRYREGNFISADFDYDPTDEVRMPREYKYYT